MKHLLDKDGDHCRFPHWEGAGAQTSNRLNVCGKPGYPYCEAHKMEVLRKRAEREQARMAFATQLVGDAERELRRGAAPILQVLT